MIHLIATGRAVRVTVTEPLTTGSVGMPVEVELSNAFDGLAAWLVWDSGHKQADVALAGGPVTVPPQVLRVAGETLKVGVYACNAAGDKVIPTVWAECGTVRQGAEPSGFEPAKPEPGWAASVREMAEEALELAGGADGRVTSLDGTALAPRTFDAVGVPAYVSDPAEHADYGLTEPGWYVFARIGCKGSARVTADTAVTGAAGSVVTPGADHVDVAVRFDVAAMSCPVTVAWAEGDAETFVFAADDLAVRNLDYRTTFYIYDLSPFVTWEFGPTSDATFTAGNFYYTLAEDGTYELAEPGSYVIGDPIPADTYYKHTKMVVGEGLTRNVTYRLDTPVDCPSEFRLPEVEDEEHGCWYEMRFMHTGSYSSVLTPMAPDVTVATQHTQAETKGINMVDLHYSAVAGHKVWRFMNTHSTFTEIAAKPVAAEFRTAPTKTAYAVGEALDVTGAEVVATYADGSKKLVTPTYAPANGATLTAGDTELTASYTEGGVTVTATTPLTITGGE